MNSFARHIRDDAATLTFAGGGSRLDLFSANDRFLATPQQSNSGAIAAELELLRSGQARATVH
jgi:hypothetical protein